MIESVDLKPVKYMEGLTIDCRHRLPDRTQRLWQLRQDTDNDHQGNTIANSLLGDNLTHPHGDHRTGRHSRD